MSINKIKICGAQLVPNSGSAVKRHKYVEGLAFLRDLNLNCGGGGFYQASTQESTQESTRDY